MGITTQKLAEYKRVAEELITDGHREGRIILELIQAIETKDEGARLHPTRRDSKER